MRGFRYFGAALVGGAAIHLAFVACSGMSRTGGDAAMQADAQTMPASCSQWAVQEILPPSYTQTPRTSPTGAAISLTAFDSFNLPAGWEPIGASGIGYDSVIARHCGSP
jgi:hypothetical protein